MRQKTVPIFSGLGSDTLFTYGHERADAQGPHGRLLLGACHKILLCELSLVSMNSPLGIDLSLFQEPHSLLQPPADIQLRQHPVLQHASLCVAQLLHYLSGWEGSDHARDEVEATAGFCAGLLPAIAVATSSAPSNIWDFLSNSERVFRLAVLLGIASDRARRRMKTMRPRHCWSVVVSGLPVSRIESLLGSPEEDAKPCEDRPWISAVTSPSCVTLSGEGTILDRFIREALPRQECVVKRTNIFSPYHNHGILTEERLWILRQFEDRGLPFPTREDLRVPVVRTGDGSLIHPSRGQIAAIDDGDLLEEVLQMVMMTRTDWAAAQDRIVALGNERPAAAAAERARVQIRDGYMARAKECEPDVRDRDIAVVGVGVDLPGSGMDLDLLWRNLMERMSTCTEVPSDRFAWRDYHDGTPGKGPLNPNRTMRTKYGNFLPDSPFAFDNELFGISPREARSMDPQQRLLLQCTHRALEHAGYTPDGTSSFSRATFGCFVGSATSDYADHLRDDIDVYYSTGTLKAFLSGRISYAFKFSGPSITVDTACSSSLVAIYQAVEALATGTCRAAVAGGVNVISSPDMYIGLDRSRFLSPTGQCKSFDQDADGYCRGEGCAVFVLKRLADAVTENDRILGVIKAAGVNQSGEAASITQPLADAQERLFQQLLQRARMKPSDVTVVEAHGTGTKAGDPCEVRSIRNVFRGEDLRSGTRKKGGDGPLFVTSIKANIGHLEAASGGAALVKLLLMLKHQYIPPQAIHTQLLPAIAQLSHEGIQVCDRPMQWTAPGMGRRTALLNNFGAAGSNAALLLQEWSDTRPPQTTDGTSYVFGCSARTSALLEHVRKDILSHITTARNSLSLVDICYTATARRSLGRHRIGIAVSSIDDLMAKLPDAPVHRDEPLRPDVFFLFSGQGSQYAGMGNGLFHSYPIFRQMVLRCHDILIDWGFTGCLEHITGPGIPVHASVAAEADVSVVQSAQTALFVLEVSLAHLLMEFGLQPTAVSGHSLGELAALVTAGVLDLEAGLWLVAQRARMIARTMSPSNPSGMLAVNMSIGQVQESFLTGNGDHEADEQWKDLEISCQNSPNDCVIGGPTHLLRKLMRVLSAHPSNRKCVMLDVPIAYHTAALAPMLTELTALAEQIHVSPPRIPVVSNVLGRVVRPGEEGVFNPAYFSRHCCSTVMFSDGIANLLNEDTTQKQSGNEIHLWVEIGPHPVLLSMVRPHIPQGATDMLIPALKKKVHPSQTLAELFANMYRHGIDGNWRLTFESLTSTPQLIELPSSPFLREQFLIPFREEKLTSDFLEKQDEQESSDWETTEFAAAHRRLRARRLKDHGKNTLAWFETPVQNLATLLEGHVICERMLCPASVYEEIALAAGMQTHGWPADGMTLKLSDMTFQRPFVLCGKDDNRVVRVVLTESEQGVGHTRFEISTATENESHKMHCTGVIIAPKRPDSKLHAKLDSIKHMVSRRHVALRKDGNAHVFSRPIIYGHLFHRVVDYSPGYQTIKRIFLSEGYEETYAVCELDPMPHTGPSRYASQPIMLDTLLHVAGFAANLSVVADECFICHSVGSLTLHRSKPKDGAFEVFCSNFTSEQEHGKRKLTADAYAVDEDGVIAVSKGMIFALTTLTEMRRALDVASGSPSRKPNPVSRQHAQDEHGRAPGQLGIVADDDEGHTTDGTTESGGDSTSAGSGYDTGATESSTKGIATPTVTAVLSETTGVPVHRLDATTSLAAIGVDSLMLLELERKLEVTFQITVQTVELSSCETVGDIESLVSGAGSDVGDDGAKKRDSSPPLSRTDHSKTMAAAGRWQAPEGTAQVVPGLSPGDMTILKSCLAITGEVETIQTPSDSATPRVPGLAPLYLIHPGAGMCYEYRRLGRLSGRAVFALHDPRIFAANGREEDWSSVEEMAEDYVDRITNHLQDDRDPRRGGGVDVLLGGYSFGGVVAFAMAGIITRRRSVAVAAGPDPHIRVRGVVLIDAPPPLRHDPLTRPTVEAAMAKKHTRHPAGRPRHLVDRGRAIAKLAVGNNVRRGQMLARYHPAGDSGPDIRLVLLRSREGFPRATETMPENEWLHGMGGREATGVEGWREVTRGVPGASVEVRMIPGDHFGPFEPENVGGTTEELRAACESLDA